MAKMCSYCGVRPGTTDDHVFPKGLYPKRKSDPKVERLTVPACLECNNSFSDDEVHFRTLLALAGDPPNAVRQELLATTIRRSFDQPDAARRLRDLLGNMREVELDREIRHKVYPGEDVRVLKVVKKIIRGLSHHHGLGTAVRESHVGAKLWTYRFPAELRASVRYAHREKDVAEYYFDEINKNEMRSGWVITFYETVSFIGAVCSSEDAAREWVDVEH